MNKKGHVLNAVLLSVGLGFVLQPTGDVETFRVVAEVSLPVVLGAVFPDVDTAFGRHRKTFHNLPVLALFAGFPLWFGNLHYVWVGVLAHYVLDVVGSTRGIALFYPLSSREFGFPTGVTTADRYADAVALVVTGLELAAVAVAVHVLPAYLPEARIAVPW